MIPKSRQEQVLCEISYRRKPGLWKRCIYRRVYTTSTLTELMYLAAWNKSLRLMRYLTPLIYYNIKDHVITDQIISDRKRVTRAVHTWLKILPFRNGDVT